MRFRFCVPATYMKIHGQLWVTMTVSCGWSGLLVALAALLAAHMAGGATATSVFSAPTRRL